VNFYGKTDGPEFQLFWAGGTGKVVCIRHELALQPGMAVYEEYPDLKDGKVKLDGDNVVEFH
jgi:hypothetical protein